MGHELRGRPAQNPCLRDPALTEIDSGNVGAQLEKRTCPSSASAAGIQHAPTLKPLRCDGAHLPCKHASGVGVKPRVPWHEVASGEMRPLPVEARKRLCATIQRHHLCAAIYSTPADE